MIKTSDLYVLLKERAKTRSDEYSILNVIVRLNDGFKKDHARIILELYFFHLLLTDRALYSRIKTATDEASMRQILSGRVRTAYAQGEKIIGVDSHMYPRDFFPIIDAYLDYTDELMHK